MKLEFDNDMEMPSVDYRFKEDKKSIDVNLQEKRAYMNRSWKKLFLFLVDESSPAKEIELEYIGESL